MHVHLIWAQDKNGVIGVNGQLPWHIPEDLYNFKRLTSGHPIVMGRKTWESLPFKPLPNRRNIVLSSSKFRETESFSSIESCMEIPKSENVGEVFIIGGAMVYKSVFPYADILHITFVNDTVFEGDTFFPFSISEIKMKFHVIKREKLSKAAEYVKLKKINPAFE